MILGIPFIRFLSNILTTELLWRKVHQFQNNGYHYFPLELSTDTYSCKRIDFLHTGIFIECNALKFTLLFKTKHTSMVRTMFILLDARFAMT